MAKNAEGRDPFLDELFEKHPQATLARKLSTPKKTISRAAINQWRKVPDHYIQAISDLGFPLKKVRRDLFDPEYRKALAATPPTEPVHVA